MARDKTNLGRTQKGPQPDTKGAPKAADQPVADQPVHADARKEPSPEDAGKSSRPAARGKQPKKDVTVPALTGPDSASTAFPIVGIGASAGGLEAFTQLLGSLPENTAIGLVLVQHLDPSPSSALTELLPRPTTLPVPE